MNFFNKLFRKIFKTNENENQKMELDRHQRVDSTAYLFMAFDRVCKSDLITRKEYQITFQNDMDKDADAIFVMLQKNNLVDDILITQLKSLGTLEYFDNLKIEDFSNEQK
jgi:hypothetical protein